MKYMMSQFAALVHGGGRQSNVKLLVRFIALLVILVTVYSVLFHVIMEYEQRDYSWVTGFYWTLTVMSTLGFGDITFMSDVGRLFSILVLLSGVIFLLVMLPFTFIRFFYAPWLEAQNRARAPRALPHGTHDHVIFTHFNNVTANLIARLDQIGIPCVTLVPDLPQALDLFDRGLRVMVGELNHPDTYRKLRVHDAAMLVVLNDDLASTNIIHTVREICGTVITVTNADLDDSLDILELAGSTHVFQFHKMLGQALARRVLGVSLKANVIGQLDELLIAEIPAMATNLVGKTLFESRLREFTGVNVVGAWEQGEYRLPTAHTCIEASTVLVLGGSTDQLDHFENLVRPHDRPDRQEGPVLILGGGRVGQAVADALDERGIDYRTVEKRGGLKRDNPRVITGSAADRDILARAGIAKAPSVIITTHDDDLNVYLAIYCRRLRQDVQIISRASLNRNVRTLHRAGVDLVMSYSSITANTIVNLLRPGSLVTLSENVSVFVAPVTRQLVGGSLRDLRLREDTGCSVIAIRRQGVATIVNPDPSGILRQGDELVLVGDLEASARYAERYVAG